MKTVLYKRIVSGVSLAAMALGLLYLPCIFIGPIILLLVLPAQFEFYNFLDQAGISSFRAIGLIIGAVLSVGVWTTAVFGTRITPEEYETLILFLAVVSLCSRQLFRKHDPQPFATLACTILGVLYVPFLFNYLLKLAQITQTASPVSCASACYAPIGTAERKIIIYLLATVKFSDVGAYFVGSRLGRHKLIPRISPGKTIEGLIGGLLSGLAAALIWFYAWGGSFSEAGELQLTLRDTIILGLVLPITGVLGDLVESMLKRASGTKDSGSLIPGMGGVLDILDSLLFAAPVLYFYLKIFKGL